MLALSRLSPVPPARETVGTINDEHKTSAASFFEKCLTFKRIPPYIACGYAGYFTPLSFNDMKRLPPQ
jgi:hypothetical protein